MVFLIPAAQNDNLSISFLTGLMGKYKESQALKENQRLIDEALQKYDTMRPRTENEYQGWAVAQNPMPEEYIKNAPSSVSQQTELLKLMDAIKQAKQGYTGAPDDNSATQAEEMRKRILGMGLDPVSLGLGPTNNVGDETNSRNTITNMIKEAYLRNKYATTVANKSYGGGGGPIFNANNGVNAQPANPWQQFFNANRPRQQRL